MQSSHQRGVAYTRVNIHCAADFKFVDEICELEWSTHGADLPDATEQGCGTSAVYVETSG